MATAPFKNLSNDSVQTIAARGIQADLKLLSHLQNGVSPSELTDGEQTHLRQTFDHYISEHPLGFLAESSPIIAQSMLHDAAKRDALKLMGAYNFASGNFTNATTQIDALSSKPTEDLLTAAPTIFNTIHREVLVKASHDLHQMANASDGHLWWTSANDESEMHQQFQDSSRQVQNAIALFDNGDTEAAMAKYSETMQGSQGHIGWFQRAYHSSEKTKFAVHIGVTMAAGAAAYFTGGATLALLGGAEAGVAAEATSLLVSGASMTLATRELDHVIFATPVLSHGTTADRALDLGGDILRNSFMMGWMRLASVAGATLPMMEGESLLASSINTAQNITFEVGSLTGFNMVASTANLIDDRYPSLEQSVSREGMMNTLAFVVGSRIGTTGLRGTITATKIIADYLPETPLFNSSEPAVAGYPLLMLGVNQHSPNVLGALYVMDGTVPPALLTTQILGLRPRTPLFRKMIGVLDLIGRSPMAARAREAIAPLGGILLSSRTALIRSASVFMNDVLSHQTEAEAAGQQVGYEFEFKPQGTRTRDDIYRTIAQSMTSAGHNATLIEGDPSFVFMSGFKMATLIQGSGRYKGKSVQTEIFDCNGTTMVSIVRTMDDATTRVLRSGSVSSLAEADQFLLKTLDASPTERYIFLTKGTDNDTFNIEVTPIGPRSVRVTGLNGNFYLSDRTTKNTLDIDLTSELSTITGVPTSRDLFHAAHHNVRNMLNLAAMAQKTNRLTGLSIEGLGHGTTQVVNEVPPALEMISARLGLGDVPRMTPMVNALQESGAEGTRAGNLVGMHVHAEVARQVNGTFSIAPALGLLRGYLGNVHYINALFPSHPNRGGFIQTLPTAMRTRLRDPNYVSDPTNTTQILRVLADYAQMTMPKYADLNMDNVFATMVDEMGQAGILRAGEKIEDSYTSPNGQTTHYRLEIRRAEGDNAPFRLYRTFHEGEVRQMMSDGSVTHATGPETVYVSRIEARPTKPTAEIRTPDALMDPESVSYIARFWGTFVYLFANRTTP